MVGAHATTPSRKDSAPGPSGKGIGPPRLPWHGRSGPWVHLAERVDTKRSPPGRRQGRCAQWQTWRQDTGPTQWGVMSPRCPAGTGDGTWGPHSKGRRTRASHPVSWARPRAHRVWGVSPAPAALNWGWDTRPFLWGDGVPAPVHPGWGETVGHRGGWWGHRAGWPEPAAGPRIFLARQWNFWCRTVSPRQLTGAGGRYLGFPGGVQDRCASRLAQVVGSRALPA